MGSHQRACSSLTTARHFGDTIQSLPAPARSRHEPNRLPSGCRRTDSARKSSPPHLGGRGWLSPRSCLATTVGRIHGPEPGAYRTDPSFSTLRSISFHLVAPEPAFLFRGSEGRSRRSASKITRPGMVPRRGGTHSGESHYRLGPRVAQRW